MKIKFYKEQGGWYADLPQWLEGGGSLADLAMVSGADTLLDKLSLPYGYNPFIGGILAKDEIKNEVTLQMQIGPQVEFEVLQKVGEDETGAWYVNMSDGHLLWLCPVTLFVFGKYPNYIYYKIV